MMLLIKNLLILLIVEDNPKTYKETMMSRDISFKKRQLMMRWIHYYITILGLLLIYLQIPRQLDVNGFS